MTKGTGQAFIALGVIFFAMGVAGKTNYLGPGLAFLAIGLVVRWRSGRRNPPR